MYIKQHHKTDFTFCFKKADKIPCILDVFQSGSTELELLISLFGPGIFQKLMRIPKSANVSFKNIRNGPGMNEQLIVSLTLSYPLYSIQEWYYILVTMY